MEQDASVSEPKLPEVPEEAPIVSVNSRGGASGNLFGKVVFFTTVAAVGLAGAVMGINKYRANQKAHAAAVEQTAKNENKPAAVGLRRTFDTEPSPPPPGAATGAGGSGTGAGPGTEAARAMCSDGTPGTVLLGPDGKPMPAPDGSALRVCNDGRVLAQPTVPALSVAPPIPMAGGSAGPMTQARPQLPSPYAGDVMLGTPSQASGGTQPSPGDPAAALSALQNSLAQLQKPPAAAPAGGPGGAAPSPAASPAGSLGASLSPTGTPMVRATMLGERNMILPKGRSIDCALSMRLVSDLAGLASCVLTQNVYSDNGRVVLLERGSEATGEYSSATAQGQSRIFVLWTRIKTPQGVVINLNSPAADALGTSGVSGYVDNHWWERLGAAFLLSFVQDAIAYKTAQATGGGGAQGFAVFQNTSETSNRMTEKVLESTINIKPTIYANQGDRGSIFVARDLDFGSVYALQAR